MKPILIASILALVCSSFAQAQCPGGRCPPQFATLAVGYQPPTVLPPPTQIKSAVWSSYSSTTVAGAGTESSGGRRVGLREKHLSRKLARVQRRHGG